MGMPPREVFAAVTRQAIEMHGEWDSPHCFQTLHWDGEKLRIGTYACIMPDLHPRQYPDLMSQMAREQLAKQPDDPAYGYLLQCESFGAVEPGPDAAADERERYERARITRTFHELDGSVEAACAWCADIHGRLWTAAKTRDKPDVISEHFYSPLSAVRPGGPFIKALLGVAYATGTIAHGLPGPLGPLSRN